MTTGLKTSQTRDIVTTHPPQLEVASVGLFRRLFLEGVGRASPASGFSICMGQDKAEPYSS